MSAPELFETSEVKLGLYIDLVEGGQIDMRAAARAALAFDALVRDLAQAVGLDEEFELNLIEGEKGSLHLKAVLASIREKVKLAAVASSVAAFIGGMAADEIRDYVRGEIMGDPEVALSEEAVNDIANAVAAKTQSDQACKHLQEITTALKSDKDVSGVGATTGVEARPVKIRPRENFAIKPAETPLAPEIIENLAVRTQQVRETVILTEPVLTTKAKRKWRVVREGQGEVLASMEDENFWEQLVAGNTGLPMSGGVHLDIILEIVSEREAETGLWKEKSFKILKVEAWKASPVQGSFL